MIIIENDFKSIKYMPSSSNKTKKRFPYERIYLKRKKCYSVRKKSKKNPKVFSKCTTKEKANKQMNLLAAILYNPKFKRKIK